MTRHARHHPTTHHLAHRPTYPTATKAHPPNIRPPTHVRNERQEALQRERLAAHAQLHIRPTNFRRHLRHQKTADVQPRRPAAALAHKASNGPRLRVDDARQQLLVDDTCRPVRVASTIKSPGAATESLGVHTTRSRPWASQLNCAPTLSHVSASPAHDANPPHHQPASPTLRIATQQTHIRKLRLYLPTTCSRTTFV